MELKKRAKQSRKSQRKYIYIFIIHFIITFGKFGTPCLGKGLQQPLEQRHPVLHVNAGSFRVSVIHRTLTWTAGSFTCILFLMRAYTHEGATVSQHNIFDSEKLSPKNSVLLTGFEPRIFGSRVRRYPLSHPVIPLKFSVFLSREICVSYLP